MKSLNILALATLCAFSASHSINYKALGAAAITWATVSPIASFLTNVVPNPLWIIGCLLVDPRDGASRYAMGGIVGGTVGTLAAVGMYRLIK